MWRDLGEYSNIYKIYKTTTKEYNTVVILTVCSSVNLLTEGVKDHADVICV